MNRQTSILLALGALGAAQAYATQSSDDGTDETLFWGTYRPIPYVGLRSRAPDSPLLGLMWSKP